MAAVVEQALTAWFEGKGLRLFSGEDLKCLDPRYFNIINMVEPIH